MWCTALSSLHPSFSTEPSINMTIAAVTALSLKPHCKALGMHTAINFFGRSPRQICNTVQRISHYEGPHYYNFYLIKCPVSLNQAPFR